MKVSLTCGLGFDCSSQIVKQTMQQTISVHFCDVRTTICVRNLSRRSARICTRINPHMCIHAYTRRQKVPTFIHCSSRWRRPPVDKEKRLFSKLFTLATPTRRQGVSTFVKSHYDGDAHQATEISEFCSKLITLATATRRQRVPNFC